MSNSSPKLSICLVHYFDEKNLKRFLETLIKFPPACSFEVIVVDNGSDKKILREILNELGECAPLSVITPNQNLGYGGALNSAAKAAQGEFLFLGNPDLEVSQGGFDKLLKFLDDNASCGIVGPALRFHDGRSQDSCRRFPTIFDVIAHRLQWFPFFKKRGEKYLFKDKSFDEPLIVDWFVGAAMMIRRNLFLELKGFDPRFFLFFEDTDFCRRVKEAGFEVWHCPSSVFLHRKKRLSESSMPGMWIFKKVFWIHVASAVKYFVKWRNK